VGERRRRLTAELTGEFITDLNRLPIDVDEQSTSTMVLTTVESLCRKHGLTAYDAAYLEIAIRGMCPLATVDVELIRAAVVEGVQTV